MTSGRLHRVRPPRGWSDFQSILTLIDHHVPLWQLSLTESQDRLPSDLDLDPIVLNHSVHEWRIQTTSRKEMRSVMAGSKGSVFMRLMAPLIGIALSLAGLTLAPFTLSGAAPQRFGSWQELSAAQPACGSMTNLTSISSNGAENLKCLMLVPCAHNDWICADRQ